MSIPVASVLALLKGKRGEDGIEDDRIYTSVCKECRTIEREGMEAGEEEGREKQKRREGKKGVRKGRRQKENTKNFF